MNYKRIIVTNNPLVARSYEKEDQVVFMDGATPHEVYLAIREMLLKGGCLSKPVLKDKTSYYTTASIFYDGRSQPTPWNLREIEAACRATEGVKILNNSGNITFRQFMDKWKNAPEHRRHNRLPN